MGEILQQALSYLAEFVEYGTQTLLIQILNYFPNADQTNLWNYQQALDVFNIPASTMNLGYFIVPSWLNYSLSLITISIVISLTIRIVRLAITMIHNLIDSIPVIG